MGRRAEPLCDLRRDCSPVVAGQKQRGVVRPQPGEVMVLERRRVERSVDAVPDRQEDRDGIRVETLRGKEQGVIRREVNPVRVVHDDQERIRLCCGGDQAQRGRADREAIVRLCLGEPEGAPECLGLLGRDLREIVQQRSQQLEQPRELELRLVLDAQGADDGHPLCLLRGIVQQGRLSHPGLGADYERAATPAAGTLEQFVDARAIGLPTDEHASKSRRCVDSCDQTGSCDESESAGSPEAIPACPGSLGSSSGSAPSSSPCGVSASASAAAFLSSFFSCFRARFSARSRSRWILPKVCRFFAIDNRLAVGSAEDEQRSPLVLGRRLDLGLGGLASP